MKPLFIIMAALVAPLVANAAIADSISVQKTLPPRISLPHVSPVNSDLANRGAYVARTADCMACHREDYSGGVAIETPIGNIYSTNITSSKIYGIGNYTEADLAKALRKGRAPNHQIYPAMPYPSYHGMTDADISALFAYFISLARRSVNGLRLTLPLITIRVLDAGASSISSPIYVQASLINELMRAVQWQKRSLIAPVI
nr:cytochrome c [uncultured Psychrobacter sp.]